MTNICENLKPGDKVFILGRHLLELDEVEKITPSGLIRVDGVLYRKDGSQRGGVDPWYRTFIKPASTEEIEQFQKEQFVSAVIRKLQSIKSLSYEQAVAVHNLLFRNEEVKNNE